MNGLDLWHKVDLAAALRFSNFPKYYLVSWVTHIETSAYHGNIEFLALIQKFYRFDAARYRCRIDEF